MDKQQLVRFLVLEIKVTDSVIKAVRNNADDGAEFLQKLLSDRNLYLEALYDVYYDKDSSVVIETSDTLSGEKLGSAQRKQGRGSFEEVTCEECEKLYAEISPGIV